MTVLALHKHNRLPLTALEPPVDPLRFQLHFSKKVVVPLDMCAAGRPNLHKRKLTAIYGPLLQKTFDSQEAFQDALGVVDPVYTDPRNVASIPRVLSSAERSE